MTSTPLVMLHPGESGSVQKIHAGGCATKRLYEMGFNIGAKIKVIKNDAGPLIVSLSGNKIALGRGLAYKVMINRDI